MQIVVAGGTGFIGRALVKELLGRGDTVTVLGRDPVRAKRVMGDGVACMGWDPERGALSNDGRAAIAQADAVVNLAGEGILNARWNDAVRARILDSRVKATRLVSEAMLEGEHRASRVLVNSSGCDYYGDTGETAADESSPAGSTFFARVCLAWEAETARVADAGMREVRLRTGVVLGEAGGALERMLLPFKMFVGGPFGGGDQWWAWISLEDVVGIALKSVDDAGVRGPVNTVSPKPERVKDFAKALGRVLGRPSWAPVPGFALKIALGEAAAVLLESKRIMPRAIERAGYVFRDPELEGALRKILKTG